MRECVDAVLAGFNHRVRLGSASSAYRLDEFASPHHTRSLPCNDEPF